MFLDDKETIAKWANAFGYVATVIVFSVVLVIASGIF